VTVSVKATQGAWTSVGGTPNVSLGGSPAAGDRYYILIAYKNKDAYLFQTTSSAGWTNAGTYTNGTTASGNGTGSVTISIWYRDWVSGDPTSVTWNVRDSTNSSNLLFGIGATTWFLLQKDAAKAWKTPGFVAGLHASSGGPSPVSSVGGDGTGGAGYVTVADGDMVFDCFAEQDDTATFTRSNSNLMPWDITPFAFTGNYTRFVTPHFSSTVGNDFAVDAGYRMVGSSATTVPTRINSTATLSASEIGACAWVVQGEVATTPQRSAALAGVGALSATATARYARTAARTGAGTLTATATARYARAATYSGAGALSATILGKYVGDSFNRANSNTSLGAGWTTRRNVMGIENNGAYAVTASARSFATYNIALDSPDMRVGLVVKDNNPTSYLVLGGSVTGDNVALLAMNYGWIAVEGTGTSWSDGPYNIGGGPDSLAVVNGDLVEFERVGTTYFIYVNGAEVAQFTNAWFNTDAAHNLAGVGGTNWTLGAIESWYATTNDYANAALSGHGSLVASTNRFSHSFTGSGALTATAARVVTPVSDLVDPFDTQNDLLWVYADSTVVAGQAVVGGGFGGAITAQAEYTLEGASFYGEVADNTEDDNWFYFYYNDFADYAGWRFNDTSIEAYGGEFTDDYDPVAHRWLRLRASIDGDTLYWDTSPDGETWTNRDSLTGFAGELDEIVPELWTNGTFTFDNFNTLGGAPSAAAGFTGSGSLTATAVEREHAAATLAGVGALTATVVESERASAALAGAGSLTATAPARFARSAALTGVGALSATVVEREQVAKTLTGVGALTAAITERERAAATLAGVGALTATARARFSRAVGLSGSGALTAAAAEREQAAAALPGAGLLTAAAAERERATATLAGVGALAATATAGYGRSVALAGAGILTTSLVEREQSTPALAGTGTLTAATRQVFARTAARTGTGALTAGTAAKFSRAATLAGAGTLSATAPARFARTTALAGSGALTALARMYRIAVAATRSGSGQLTATATARYTRTLSLSGSGSITAAASMYRIATSVALAGAGTLTTQIKPRVTGGVSGAGQLSATAVKYREHTAASLPGAGVLEALAEAVSAFDRNAHLEGEGALAATAAARYSRAVPLTGTGLLTATAVMYQIRQPAALGGSGQLTASNAPSIPKTLTGAGQLSATASMYRIASAASVSGSGALAATGVGRYQRAATLAGTGTLSAAARVYRIASPVTLSGAGQLTATGTARFTRAAMFAGSGALTAAAQMYQTRVDEGFAGAGALTLEAHILGGVSVSLSGSGAVTATARMYRIASGGVLSGTGALTATAEGAEAVQRSAALSGAGSLSATATAVLTAAVSLSGTGALTAAATAQSQTGAHLSGVGSLTAVVRTVSRVSLSGDGELTATATAVFRVDAELLGDSDLTATATPASYMLAVPLTGVGVLTATARKYVAMRRDGAIVVVQATLGLRAPARGGVRVPPRGEAVKASVPVTAGGSVTVTRRGSGLRVPDN
jgi:hypothetical protein